MYPAWGTSNIEWNQITFRQRVEWLVTWFHSERRWCDVFAEPRHWLGKRRKNPLVHVLCIEYVLKRSKNGAAFKN